MGWFCVRFAPPFVLRTFPRGAGETRMIRASPANCAALVRVPLRFAKGTGSAGFHKGLAFAGMTGGFVLRTFPPRSGGNPDGSGILCELRCAGSRPLTLREGDGIGWFSQRSRFRRNDGVGFSHRLEG